MSNAYLSPILQQNQFTGNANFLAGGLIWSYVAGTTTPQAAYTNSLANTAWPNPIVLNQRGEPGGEIWLAAGQTYKFVLEEAPFYGQTHGVVVSTFDNVAGVNDATISTITPNWIAYSGTPTYISSTSFSVAGDQRTIFQYFRRLKTINNSGAQYSTILSSTFAAGITTVVVSNDPANALDSGLSQVYYSFVETSPSSIPLPFLSGTTMLFIQASAPTGWTKVTSYNNYALRIVSGSGAGTGGSVDFTTAFSNSISTDVTTLSTSQIPSHAHGIPFGSGSALLGNASAAAWGANVATAATAYTNEYNTFAASGRNVISAAGGGGSHSHTIPLAVKYVDAIIATKD
jgi:hypothetical protein